MPTGTAVRLVRLDASHAEKVCAWLNNPTVNQWLMAGQLPISHEEELAFYQTAEERWRDGIEYEFEIHVIEGDRYIGNCGLTQVTRIHRSAEAGIFIGSLADQNRGFGRDALLTLLRFGFDTLGLHRITLRAADGNDRARHLYASMGFTQIGRERETVFLRGRFHDHVVFDMLEDEFRERYGPATRF